MAAGVIPIANDSGGPRADIVVPLPVSATDAPVAPLTCDRDSSADVGQQQEQITGYLASSVEQYAASIAKVI